MPLEDIQDPFLRSIVAKVAAQQQGPPAPAAPAPTPAPQQDDGTSAAINQLLQQRMGRDWSVMPIPPPRSANENDVGGRYFLSGLTQGWNNQFRDRTSRHDSELARLLALQEQRRYHDMMNQNADERLAAMQGRRGGTVPGEPKAAATDPYADKKAAWWDARIKSLEALAERRSRPDRPRASRASGSKAGGAAGNNRAELAARYRSRLAQAESAARAIGAKENWSKGEIDAAVSRQRARISAEYNALVKGESMPDESQIVPQAAPQKTKDQILKDFNGTP